MNDDRKSHPRYLTLAALAATVTLGCSNEDAFGPSDFEQLRFSEPITVGDLNSHLTEGPARAEIKLLDQGLVAREVEIESSDELFEEEKLEFAILEVDDANSMLIVNFDGLAIQFDGSTTFEDADGSEMARADFVAFVLQETNDGRTVGVEAKRPAPSEPQAPDDETFVATKLELEDVDDRKVEMNIDADNLVTNDPDAVITVLGRPVELRLADGITELEREDDDFDDEIKFKDFVQSTGDGLFTLQNGTVIQVVEGVTEIDDGADKKRLGSLAEVQGALDDGLSVRAKGEAVLAPDKSGALIAVEVRFKIKREDKEISLQELALLLNEAPARAEIELRNSGLVIREFEVESEDDDEEDEEEIEAHITSVDGGSITVDIDGLTITFDDNTDFEDFDGNDITLAAFVGLVEAELAAERTPRVDAKRPSPAVPQVPADDGFLAASLRLDEDDDDDERKMEINVGAANLVVNEPRPEGAPDATLQVLGVTLEIRVTDGLTELEVEGD